MSFGKKKENMEYAVSTKSVFYIVGIL